MRIARLLLAAGLALASCISGGSDSNHTSTFGISGTVSGEAAAGVSISLGGGATAATTTDVSGGYRFAGLANGTYVVTPTLAGQAFAPASRSVAVNGADVVAQDFTATAVSITYAVSGTVSGAVTAGVTISLGGAASASTTTDASGRYRFTGLADGTYVVTPTFAGYTFAPASRSVAVNGADAGGQDFTAAAVTYAISGWVSGSVTAGVTVSLSGAATATTTTDAGGGYRFPGLANGTYVVTPTLAGHTFAPASRSVAVNGADVVAQDFTATAVSITYAVSGTVSGAVTAGVTISLGGAATTSTTTDASGRYRFTGLANGTYVVTPTFAGYTFVPASRSVTVDGSDEVLEPFAAQLATWDLVASGTSSVLRAVWGSSPEDIWMVGDGPILHWDGSSITGFGNPTGRSLNAVWGASAIDVWAVGDVSIVHWDGSSWTTPSSASALDIELRGLYGSSANDIWAIGMEPWHFDGALWSRGTAPLPKYEVSDEMDGIWGSAPDDIWVVGDDVDRFDGSRWGLYVYDCDLHGVWGASRSNVWAVGSAILHYDGRTWGFVPSPIGEPGVTATLRAVWGSSSRDVWAVGGGKVLHWGGSRWDDVQPTVGGSPLWGVWGSSASDLWMVGENGTIIRYH